jgi:uncharacterized protein HemY
MGKRAHILIVLLLAASMATYLYAYKPRNYDTTEVITNFIVNISFWTVIFGVAYMIVWEVITFVRRHLFKFKSTR